VGAARDVGRAAPIVPATFDTCATATIFAPVKSSRSKSRRPASSNRRDPQRRATLGAQHLPRHEVRVVLELGRDHDVARTEVGAAPALRDQVDRCSRAAREHHLTRCPAEPRRDKVARVVTRHGGRIGERVDRAERTPGVVVETRVHGLDHGAWTQGGRRAVEVGKPPASDADFERRSHVAALRDR